VGSVRELLVDNRMGMRRLLGPALYIGLVTGALFVAFRWWGYDDPYITYRYAENLRHGIGFIYNPGERVLSTTTPLFALLLALLGNILSDLPQLANLIGGLSLALGSLFLWDLAHSWKSPLVGWAALLLYPSFPLMLSTMGSEIPLYLSFCLGAFASYTRQRYHLAALSSALAVLTRPDGALVVVILIADYLLHQQRPIPVKSLLLFLSLTLPWVVFSWGYFGSPVPVTLVAKQHQASMTISQHFAPGLWTIVGWYSGHWHYRAEAVLSLLGVVFLVRRARTWLLFLAWPMIYFIAYSALGVSRYFWYYAPLVPGFIAAIGLGARGLVDLFARGILLSFNEVDLHLGRRHLSFSRDEAAETPLSTVWSSVVSIFGITVVLLLAVCQVSDLMH